MVPVIKGTVAALLLILLFSATVFVGWALSVHTVWSLVVWAVAGPWVAWKFGIERGRMDTQ